ncbi:uncharacterized protein [Apostichopus japonicus]|uniref:uncharacterized protein n=1 Tax=Stichopus japonicus TaxID=307972 RepID=UPI003AB83F20
MYVLWDTGSQVSIGLDSGEYARGHSHTRGRAPGWSSPGWVGSSFENRWGFPQCVGAIDGSHIPIISPTDHPADYYNRKGFHSIVLQAVVDFRYRYVTYITRGKKVNGVFACFAFNKHHLKTEERSSLFICKHLGSKAKRFPITDLVEHAWSSKMFLEGLKERWCCLMKRNDTSMESLPTQVIACCSLHNLCKLRRDHVNDNRLEEAEEYRQQQLYEDPHDGQDNTRAISSRDALQYFAERY